MKNNLEQLAYEWITAEADKTDIESAFYCRTRDIFEARSGRMFNELVKNEKFGSNSYVIMAAVGEIGNNSFDHNIGSWSDVPGTFFGYEFEKGELLIVMADRGQGILKTLKKVKPELKNDAEALKTAFTEKISGRAPENRGNGLKFVKKNVEEEKMHLTFLSGNAQAELNERMVITEKDKNLRGCLVILKVK
ncbi:MAG: hypothetical protein WCW25_02090 [Patescibacteria group bacterium]